MLVKPLTKTSRLASRAIRKEAAGAVFLCRTCGADMTGMELPSISVETDRQTTGPAEEMRPAAFQATAGDNEACRLVIDHRTLIIDRDVGGLTCRVSLPVSFYDGIALVVGANSYAVCLMNRDPDLTLTIGGLADLGAALDLRDDLARQFRLPALSVSRDGEICGDEGKLGAMVVRRQQDRRGSLACRRRPRFLARRAGGHDRGPARISGREIIARD